MVVVGAVESCAGDEVGLGVAVMVMTSLMGDAKVRRGTSWDLSSGVEWGS